ncbi:polysaccharide biosynthesis/export family protein [Christiangramia sp. SM2212]|uniref:Polysaccharide biosynthesis/export family protein n=1 Tax=Christiangramia sediminicola TaxID=3073267 RepID=A0ABU1EQA5_9FLAO|nr:polysaccharide biosynthesis/export family protein [Christiangramia sp. SM2212]MDR5590560.1 polysaccharide biosynthesis/export family protein [Christiangramia sp. SM2212]
MRKILSALIINLVFISCATKENVVYFYEGKEVLENRENLLMYEPKIKNNDVLKIDVSSSSLNEEIVAPFQMRSNSEATGGGGQNLSLSGYLVSEKGTINFPVLGVIEVVGLKPSEVQDKLESRIEKYVKSPIVDIRIINYSITVLGEVAAPGRFQVNDGRITILEVIAMAGDITIDGKRENITIIREEDGMKKVASVDITETSFFSSEFFYLKQNDIVYVEPTYRAVKSAGFLTSVQGILGLGTTILSIYLLINSL